jgi:site-specific recombinase XerD
MNLNSLGLKLSKAILGFLQQKSAEGLSPGTLLTYKHILKIWLARTGDVEVDRISTPDLREYLVWLRTDFKPSRFSGSDRPLSPKSIRNAWIALSAFFTCASVEFKLDSPLKGIPPPIIICNTR